MTIRFSHRAVLCSLLLGMVSLASPVHAQGWDWQWATYLPELAQGSDLVAESYQVLPLGENDPLMFLRRDNQDGTYYLVQDSDPSPTGRAWVEDSLHTDGYPHDFWWSHFMVEEDLIRATQASRVGETQVMLDSYTLDPTADTVWTFEASLELELESSEGGELYCRYLDLDGDDILDWVFLQGDLYQPNVHILLLDSDSAVRDHIQHQVLPTVAEPLSYSFQGMSVVHLGPETSPLFQLHYRVTDDGGMQPETGPQQVRYVRNWDSDSPLMGTVSVEAGYTSPFSSVDLDGDGTDELLVNRLGTWEVYSTTNGTSMVLSSTLSPPSEIVAMVFDPLSESSLYLSRTNYWDASIERWVADIHRWSHNLESDRWTRLARIIDHDPLLWFRCGTAMVNGEEREYAANHGYYYGETGEERSFTNLYWQPDVPTMNWIEDSRFRFQDTGSYYAPVFTNLDRDEDLEGIVRTGTSITELDYQDDQWVLNRSWEIPEDLWVPFYLLDLNGDQLDDVYFADNTALLQWRHGDDIDWQHVNLFDDLPEEQRPAAEPFCIADADGNGFDDFFFVDGTLLLNNPTLAIKDTNTPSIVPSSFRIAAATPNPFNPTTTITLAVPEVGYLRVVVYDILGREVAMLQDGVENAGMVQVDFDGSGLATGTYLVRATLDDTNTQVRKVVLVK